MFNKFIKKHNKKIIAFIGVLATTICGVLGITKTYAYNDNNNVLSYTLDTDTIILGQYNLSTTIKNEIGTNNEEYEYIEVQHNNSSSSFMSFGINLNSDLTYNNNDGNYVALINLEYGYYSGSTWYTFTNSNYYITSYVGNNANTTNFGTQTRTLYYSISNYGYNYKSTIMQLYAYSSVINFNNTLYFNFRLPQATSSTSYCIRIYNIDIVPQNQVYTQQYIDTYYAPLEEQYNQLLEDYEELENDYDTLQDNYDTLENDYNDLSQDYEQLNQEYYDLTNVNSNGIWAYFEGFAIVALNNNQYVNLETYQTLNDFLESEYINGIEINLTSLKTNYPEYNTFGILMLTPSNYSKLILNQLAFKIETNSTNTQVGIGVGIGQGLGLDIQLTNTIVQAMGYRITYENIREQGITQYSANEDVTQLMLLTDLTNNETFKIQSLNNAYNSGYVVGYRDGFDSRQTTVDSLNEQIENLNREITIFRNTINSLEEQIQAYNRGINLNNLMWTIGSVPFESFKHIWNVNFLGVNIADFILGFITTFIGLYVVKKFFF